MDTLYLPLECSLCGCIICINLKKNMLVSLQRSMSASWQVVLHHTGPCTYEQNQHQLSGAAVGLFGLSGEKQRPLLRTWDTGDVMD